MATSTPDYSLTMYTHLHSLRRATISGIDGSLPLNKQKKYARITMSKDNASSSVGFLHASLICLDGTYIALAGPSGIGKTTISNYITEHYGAEVIANDWVAVECEGGRYYASDVNLKEELKHLGRVELEGVLLLSANDKYLRDAYSPIDSDLENQLHDLFDDMPRAVATKLARFWMKHMRSIGVCVTVPTRDSTLEHVLSVIDTLVYRIINEKERHKVGIIGLGNVGSQLASDIGKLSYVENVYLHNRTHATAVGLALDLNHARHQGRHDVYIATDDIQHLFRECDQVFIVIGKRSSRKKLLGVPERWAKIIANRTVIERYARMAGSLKYKGTVFLITNPVDYFTYTFYETAHHSYDGFCTFQVYGVGLELDYMRAQYYLQQAGYMATSDEVEIGGNHSGELIYKIPVKGKAKHDIINQVIDASPEVRKYVPRTVYGPVSAAMRTYEAFIKGGRCHVTTIRKQAFIGEANKFCRLGVTRSLSTLHGKSYQMHVESNRRRIALLAKVGIRRDAK